MYIYRPSRPAFSAEIFYLEPHGNRILFVEDFIPDVSTLKSLECNACPTTKQGSYNVLLVLFHLFFDLTSARQS
jgi:hypothetical protein